MDSTHPDPIPTPLFKYLDEEGGIKTLENLTLMFSNPADFNDPFEFLPALNETRPVNEIRDRYARNSFIFCMTKREFNVRMWDHYGDKHRGLMISLDFQDALASYRERWIRRVDYDSEERFPLLKDSLSSNENAKLFEAIVTHKGKDWEPEAEYRWFLPRQNCHCEGQPKEPDQIGEVRVLGGKEKAFLPISPASILKVTLGFESGKDLLKQVLGFRSDHKAPWEVTKAKLSPNTFQFIDDVIVPAG
jgi:hypothetical protein